MDTTLNTISRDDWQNRVHRYTVPAEQLSGKKKLYFSQVGDVPVGDNESVLLHFTAGKAYATIYVYSDMADVVPYLAVEQNARINVFKTVEDARPEPAKEPDKTLDTLEDVPMPIAVSLNLVSGDTKGDGSKD